MVESQVCMTPAVDHYSQELFLEHICKGLG